MADPDLFYTLCLTEPIEPKPIDLYPLGREYLHWLVINIPGNDLGKGYTLFEYNSSTIINLSMPNRYVFLLYLQPSYITFNKTYWQRKFGQDFSRFTIFEFAYQNQFEDPMGGNFFLTGYKDPTFLGGIITPSSPNNESPKEVNSKYTSLDQNSFQNSAQESSSQEENSSDQNSFQNSAQESNSQEKNSSDQNSFKNSTQESSSQEKNSSGRNSFNNSTQKSSSQKKNSLG
ncbi:uncharacterized protein LOC112694047 isoform X2 [Sipha flava]|nr:uncharacterized protein LOC112694047 isoform X2 [Sipha flava]